MKVILDPEVFKFIVGVQLSSENLTIDERNFLLAAISLHIAIKLQQGSFGDLDGSPDVLRFLGIESFRFSDEYLKVLNFWLLRLPKGIELWSSLQIDALTGEVYCGGANIRERFIEPDRLKRAQRQKDLITEDYRRSISDLTELPVNLLTSNAMQDFMGIREVLGALTRNVGSEDRSKSQMPLQNLGELISTIEQIRAY